MTRYEAIQNLNIKATAKLICCMIESTCNEDVECSEYCPFAEQCYSGKSGVQKSLEESITNIEKTLIGG